MEPFKSRDEAFKAGGRASNGKEIAEFVGRMGATAEWMATAAHGVDDPHITQYEANERLREVCEGWPPQ